MKHSKLPKVFSHYNEDKQKDNTSQEKDSALIRLNRFISNSGVCSRREADELISQGLITVNGKTITELGYKVSYNDEVRYDGRLLNPEKKVYLLLNKPKDYITTTDDPKERKTVMQLVAGACKERIFPVGRLDRNTTGLLLFTNDGELSDKLTHPSNNIYKIYQVDLDTPLSQDDYEKIKNGKVYLEDGRVQVDDIEILNNSRKSIGLAIHEGRNRIVRRLFEHLGYQVVKLDRTMYAGLTKKNLPRGHWRFLTQKEINMLKSL
ncbi:MAG: rRNA pseudouridine synthase [Cytophagaceae bacterium]|nr:rRNA pseudouridine synthase [Cytophagaceae bacterium]MDW8455724.1 pseudouridine synthase [Cytophagaceae bacterium]